MDEKTEALVRESEVARVIIKGLMASAELDYTGKQLRFDSTDVSAIMRATVPETYHKKVVELQAEREATA